MNDLVNCLTPLIGSDNNDEETTFGQETKSITEMKLKIWSCECANSNVCNVHGESSINLIHPKFTCTCTAAWRCNNPAFFISNRPKIPNVPDRNSSSSLRNLMYNKVDGMLQRHSTCSSRRAFLAIGGMCDPPTDSKNRTSELELIEEDLTPNCCSNDYQQQHQLSRLHFTPKNAGGHIVTGNETSRPATPTTFHSMDNSSDNIKNENYQQMFVELYDLDLQEGGKWTETARWVKYEEDVEGADHHWGQPHVAFLSFHALLSLRKFMRTGMILLDSKATTFTEICDQVADAMISEGINCKRKDILQILRMKQAHPSTRRMTRLSLPGSLFERRFECNLTTNVRDHTFQTNKLRTQPTITEVNENESHSQNCTSTAQHNDLKQQSTLNLRPTSSASVQERVKTHASEFYKDEFIRKKLPAGTETVQIFVGILPNLKKSHFVMLRLSEPKLMMEILDGEVPLRFAVVLLGPYQPDVSYHEVGRSIATLMVNKKFSAVAYEATMREELINGVDNFLDDSVVIPPGEIDSKRLISGDEIRKVLKKKRNWKETEAEGNFPKIVVHEDGTNFNNRFGNEKRSRFFNGLVCDFKKRFPYYWSDYRDALNFQCLTSVVFMFFASFAPAITFGGLLGKYTNETVGIIETLMAQCICGVLWGLFSAQPLMIMSATGPVLVFEVSLFTFCTNLDIDFLTVRLYAGIWILLIAAITAAVDGSRMLNYVTRFTEDIFASLISIIFIAESLRFLRQTFVSNPVMNFETYQSMRHKCNVNAIVINDSFNSTNCSAEPNTALLSTFIMICTFALSCGFRQLQQSYYLGRTLRRAIGDFGVLISIVVVACITHLFLPDPYLQRLEVPDHFGFTSTEARKHGLFVSAYLPLNQFWAIMMALAAALLVFILLFVETEITELLLSRKDRGLVKGSGLHWDLLLMGLCTLLCSILGMPWMCAAAVQSLAHCSSLTVPKRTVPGERPGVDHVIEQRVTTIGVSLLMGLFAFGGSYLRLPVALLFGVFLYLGVMNLSGVQLIQRIILFFIPEKYFPDTPYTESVNVWRIHLYTVIQITCLITIYGIKYFKQTSLAFPFILILFILLRHFILSKIFSEKELKALDGDDKSDENDGWLEKDFFEDAPIPV